MATKKTDLRGAEDEDDVLQMVRKPELLTNPADWSFWAESFIAYADLARINDRDKVKVLLTYLSPRILRNKVGTATFSDAELNDLPLAMTKLGKLIGSPSNKISKRLQLVRLKQGSMTLTEFIENIRRISKDCAFEDETVRNSTMLTSLIAGLTNNMITFELLKKRDGYSGFEEAVDDAVMLELAKSTMAENSGKDSELLFDIQSAIKGSEIETTTEELQGRYDKIGGLCATEADSWNPKATTELIYNNIRSSIDSSSKKTAEALQQGNDTIRQLRAQIQQMQMEDDMDLEDDVDAEEYKDHYTGL